MHSRIKLGRKHFKPASVGFTSAYLIAFRERCRAASRSVRSLDSALSCPVVSPNTVVVTIFYYCFIEVEN